MDFMSSFLNVLSIIGATVFMIFFFGFCIFIHELGHFLAAKWRGLKVTAFSIGFRKIWGKTWNGVEYRIGWIPFGGYVEIPQVDGDGAKVKDENGNDIDWEDMEEDFVRGSIITSFRIVNPEDYDLASMRYVDIT